MDKIIIAIKVGATAVGSFLAYLFGGFDVMFIVLAAFMAIDYVTGVAKAFKNKDVSSDVGRVGLLKKGAILAILVVAVLMDKLIGDTQQIFRTVVCMYYIANEGVSILENIAVLGVPIPKKLKEALVQLKDKADQDENQE